LTRFSGNGGPIRLGTGLSVGPDCRNVAQRPKISVSFPTWGKRTIMAETQSMVATVYGEATTIFSGSI
ncbi:hypothetical protein A2U01_0070174, partial [Trifolium medium]|nr:hypothetical protein [Trifolium medium]